MSREARKAVLTQQEASLSSEATGLEEQLQVKLRTPCSHALAQRDVNTKTSVSPVHAHRPFAACRRFCDRSPR